MKIPNTKEYHIRKINDKLNDLNDYENVYKKMPNYDNDGRHTWSLLSTHKSLASNYYLAYENVEKFRYHMKEASKLTLSMIQRHLCTGENVLGKATSAYYEEVCNALAGCDFALAEELSKSLWEGKKKDEKRFKCRIMSFGCITFGLLMNDDAILKEWLPKAYELSQKAGFTSYAPHPFTVEGIWKKDIAMINKGLESFAELHTRFVKTDPDPYENFICIRGIGLANLAIHRCLSITIPDSEFFPKDLIYQKK